MEPIQFDQLPYLCLRKIFSFLKLRDLANCRAVNRLFKSYADQVQVDELVVETPSKFWPAIQGRRSEPPTTKPQIDRPVDRSESTITWKQFSSAISSSFQLDQLKCLYIYDRYDFVSYSELLSGFKQLVRLELDSYRCSERDPKPLALPNLKVLVVHTFGLGSLVLKTPKLEVLRCSAISGIRLEHPETIKRIECCGLFEDDLAMFKNLQNTMLVCDYVASNLDLIRLSNQKGLRELQITSKFFSRLHHYQFEGFRSSMLDMIRQLTVSKRKEPKLYLGEVHLVDAGQLNDFNDFNDATISNPKLFMFKHYRQLRRDVYPDVAEVNLNELMKLEVELSSEFFDRFPRIQRLIATGPVWRDQFEWFLQNAPALRALCLTNDSLDKMVLNRLPEMNSRLTYLEVKEKKKNLTINFDFVLRFKQLRVFKTDRDLGSLDLATKAFRQLNELESFRFRAGSEYTEINRCSSIKNDYSLEFFATAQAKTSICKEGLSWAQLAALYDLRRNALTFGSKKRRVSDADEEAANFKRARW